MLSNSRHQLEQPTLVQLLIYSTGDHLWPFSLQQFPASLPGKRVLFRGGHKLNRLCQKPRKRTDEELPPAKGNVCFPHFPHADITPLLL